MLDKVGAAAAQKTSEEKGDSFQTTPMGGLLMKSNCYTLAIEWHGNSCSCFGTVKMSIAFHYHPSGEI
jgi:hypothetical protein